MAYERKTIYVYENWSGPDPRFMGTLYAEQTRGAEHFSFEYAEEYLREERALIAIDPELMLPGETVCDEKAKFRSFFRFCPGSLGKNADGQERKIQSTPSGRKTAKVDRE